MAADVLVLSPHPDDAALSLGSAIAHRHWGECTVVNVFSDQRYSLLSGTDIGDILDEDEAALRELGAEAIMLGLPEADVRLHRRPSELMGYRAENLARSADSVVLPLVLGALRDHLMRSAPSVVCIPLAVGGHVDHVLVREAALVLLREMAYGGIPSRWCFYEDLPYEIGRAHV